MKACAIVLAILFSFTAFSSTDSDIAFLKKEVLALKKRVEALEKGSSPFSAQDMKGQTISMPAAGEAMTPEKKKEIQKQIEEMKKQYLDYFNNQEKILKEIDEGEGL